MVHIHTPSSAPLRINSGHLGFIVAGYFLFQNDVLSVAVAEPFMALHGPVGIVGNIFVWGASSRHPPIKISMLTTTIKTTVILNGLVWCL